MLMPSIRPAYQATQELMASKGWKELTAVRNGKVHVLDEAKWNLMDACTREHLIRLLPALLTGQLS
ncbi:hypothetical protein DFQ01_1217 [Paenibacillus cellulosilyticus]|uniref:Fe/B12 periplasmic-binding domain-containing protein n=1 Tax=Paenibacillus cellulosilyticus TaxID=375489 RepID=A0A2V2YNV8_9BACL|nr:hypothetical protein [Paenibacillus cellulosilyticus]PWV97365.1 hypothetical protein DFQ01_1217 [Paenibacillus cellulosilyticus]QKS48590.1 hypothetical protein HUB94_30640 [Paenibacillus cellulosilyticus]